MTVVATGELDLRLSPASSRKLENDIGGSVTKAGTSASGKLGAALSGAFAAAGAIRVFGSFLDEATEAAKVGRDTAAVIKSTGGVANVTAGDVGKLAEKLSVLGGVDDELVQSSLNVLATFTNIRNTATDKTFDRAALAAANLSARFKTDLSSATLQVGKALNDPIKGVTALSRAGVQFSVKQKAMIKSLVESGDLLGAQNIILKELSVQTAGAFEASATPAQKLKVSLDNVKESLGTALLPIVQKVSEAFINLSPGMQKLVVVGGLLVGALVVLAPAIAAIIPIITAITLAGLGTAAMFAGIGVAVGLLAVVVVKNWDTIKDAITTAVSFVIEFVKTNWPLLIGILLGPIGIVVSLIIKNFDTIKGVIGGAIDWVRNNWPLLLAILTGPIGLAVLAITKNFDKIKEVGSSVFGAITGAVQGFVNVIRGALDWISKLISAIAKIKFPKIPGQGVVGNVIGKIPGFAEGGIVPGRIGQPQLAIVHGGETVTPPGQSAPGGTMFRDLIIQGATFEGADRTASSVVRELRAEAYRQGR